MNLNLLMMTSTKGHFGRTDIYKTTVESLEKTLGLSYFAWRQAHIKVSPDEMELGVEMRDFLQKFERAFDCVELRQGSWRHGEQSHQSEYIKDIRNAVTTLNSHTHGEYTLFMEDDWIIKSHDSSAGLYTLLYRAERLLALNPDIMQVRIPRFSNEFDRINRLQAKHGIPAKAEDTCDFYFRCNDWSNNPFICRTRDLYLAMELMAKNPQAFIQHSEHGFGRAMRYLSPSELCLAVFKPYNARAYHIGTKVGEEDKLDHHLASD